MRYMNKKFTLALILGFILGMALFTAKAMSDDVFIKGEYGHKCYIKGTAHGNIEYPIYYKTVEDCLKSLNVYDEVNLHVERI